MVTRHCGRCCPGEVIVQRAPEPFVAIKSGIVQGLIETGDCALVHLVVDSVAAVSTHDRSLITVVAGVRSRAAECLRPVRSEALGMLWMDPGAERIARHVILQ